MAAAPLNDEDFHEFLLCARYGELEDVAAYVTDGVDVNFADEGGNSALHKAAANGHVEVAKFLVANKAKFAPNTSGNTPLHWASLNGQKDMVEFLLTAFPDIDVLEKNSFGRSALTEALQAGHEDIGRAILNHKSVDAAMARDAPSATDEGDEDAEEDDDDDIFDEEDTAATDGSAPPPSDTAGGAGIDS